MKKLEKFLLPALLVFVLAVIYFNYFAPTEKLGDFSKFGDSEINQTINVLIIKENGFGKNANGDIISFKAKDKNNVVANINLHEPAPDDLENAEIVELLGHMHGNNFGAADIKIIK